MDARCDWHDGGEAGFANKFPFKKREKQVRI